MFDETSRYYNLPTATAAIRNNDGTQRDVRYVQPRIIPPQDASPTIIEHTVGQGERVDTITASYLGDPLLFWQLCDSNNVLTPEDLEQVGKVIKITMGVF
jgi:hypothetical protein